MAAKPSLLFMGSPELAVTHLNALLQAGFPIVGVVTQPDKPAGRGQKLTPPPVKVYAQEKGLLIFQPERPKSPEFVDEIKKLNPDFMIVVAYGRILSEALIRLPKLACLNVHFSLLPKYRGASCVLSAIRNGETETGVTVMQVVEKLDAGPIYLQEKVEIAANETTGELQQRLAQKGALLLLQSLDGIATGKLQVREQDESQASFAPLIAKEEGKIDWTKSAQEIHNHIRAMNPWPVAFTAFEGKKIKIYESINFSNAPQPPLTLRGGEVGKILKVSAQGLEVACGSGSILLTSVQPESKKRMSAQDFFDGYQSWISAGKVFS
ncbi:MAG: methionyl-tRNA formyltransferase [Deltaproteobacteria bacterium]|nr:methionyl-tRNA formyltransferase [Deltaproteobacteria bacterium]